MARYFLILLALPLLGLDNAKTVHNRTASALTSYPVTLHYWLAQGEVANYPRPYLTPSDTSVRAAAPLWQADVKSRWRDGSSSRPITGVLSGDPWWATGGNGLTSIVVASGVATVTTTVPHNLQIGDRVVVSLATGDNDLNRDHYVVIEPPTTYTFKVRTQSVANGTYANAGLTVTHVLEPWGSGQCRIKSPSHGLEVSEAVTISGVDGMVGVNGSWLVSAVSLNEFLINTTCSGTFISGGEVTGPSWGSVKTAHVSFIGTVPASGSLMVDVVNSTTPCHSGDAAACRDAATPVAQMTQDVSWGAQIDATAVVVSGSTATKSANAKTILAAWNGVESYCGTRYWLRGPVVTEWIVEGGNGTNDAPNCGASDFGWKTVMSAAATLGNTLNGAIDASQTTILTTSPPTFTVGSRLYFAGTTSQYTMTTETMLVTGIAGNTITVERGYEGSIPYAHANGKSFGVMQWQDDASAAYQNLHPSFTVRYYPGWAGVRVEARMENPYWERLATAWYAPTIKTGASLTTRWTRGETNHPARARWRKIFWDGADPEFFCSTGGDPDGACAGGSRQALYRVDHNRKYLEYAGALSPRNDADSATTMDQWINGYLSSSTGWRYGWHYTDKGDYGVQRKMDADEIAAPTYMPYLYPGEGNINNEFRANWAAARNWSTDNASQGWQSAEGWWPMPTDALWLHTNFSDGGYEMSMGTSVPGGGGNSAVEGHLQMFIRESAARPYVAGWPDLATGRNVSLHSRPNMTTFHTRQNTSGAEDSFGQACANAVTIAPGSTLFSAQIWWPCAAGDEGFASGTVQGLEPGHLSDYQSIPWIITGDDWLWQGLVMKAAWSAGLGYSTPLTTNTKLGRNLGKIHAEAIIAGNHIRMRTWPEMSIVQALMATPTEPLFGQTYIPERALLNVYAWDFALAAEGYQNKTDGWAARLFPLRFTTDLTGFSAALTASTSSDRWRVARWLSGPNANGYFHPSIMSLTDCAAYGVDLGGAASGCDSSHQFNYEASVMTHARDIGLPQFRYAREALGKWYVNGILNRNTNPFLLGQYRDATKLTNSPIAGAGQRPQSWTEFFNAYQNTSAGKLRNAWYSGTIGFSMKLLAGLKLLADINDATTPGCTPTDRPPLGCTGVQAVAFAEQTMPGMDYATISDDPRWAGIVARPAITSVRATWSAGTASLSWIAPTGAGCTVALNPTSSLDSTDSVVTATGRIQTFSGAAADGSTYRITCGQARYQGVL